jgi:hypothetical protein
MLSKENVNNCMVVVGVFIIGITIIGLSVLVSLHGHSVDQKALSDSDNNAAPSFIVSNIVVIGYNAQTKFSNCIVIGPHAESTAEWQLVLGTNVYDLTTHPNKDKVIDGMVQAMIAILAYNTAECMNSLDREDVVKAKKAIAEFSTEAIDLLKSIEGPVEPVIAE